MVVGVLDVLERGRDQQSAAQAPPRRLRRNGGARFKREVQLGGEAAGANMIDAAHESGVEVRSTQELEECGFRVGAGNHVRRHDALARLEHARRKRDRLRRECLATGAPVRMIGACGNGRLGQRIAQRAHPALWVATAPGHPPPTPPPGDTAGQHRARRARTEVRAEHGIEPQRAFERRGVEVLFEQIVNIHAADAQQLAHVAAPQLAYLPADAQQRQSIRPSRQSEARRYPREHRRERRGEAPHSRAIGRIGRAHPQRTIQLDRQRPDLSRAQLRRGAMPWSAGVAPPIPARAIRAARSRRRSAGIRCKRCAPAETLKPGANSRVDAAPPTWAAASSTSTERPPRASVAAQIESIVTRRR